MDKKVEDMTIDEIFDGVELPEVEYIEIIDGEKVMKSKIQLLKREQDLYGYEMELY